MENNWNRPRHDEFLCVCPDGGDPKVIENSEVTERRPQSSRTRKMRNLVVKMLSDRR